MSSYENFARVYDELMDDVPYEAWADQIQKLLEKYGISPGLMLELGCGTGRMMEMMGRKGYDMIGVDSSVEMLQIAREKVKPGDDSFLYLLQDMRSFELYGTVGAVISICDSINYITRKEDLGEVFRLVNNYLDPGGVFVFDFNTDDKYRSIGDSIIAEDREDVSFIWYNDYDEENQMNYIDLSVFVREEDGRYQKYTEEHIQRGYTLEEIRRLIEKSGLRFLGAYDGYSDREAREDSERIVVVAGEYGKR
ncbi:MAG: class I SAM-dependent methyltransferase [Eubacterium sp.]|nr:class I SAM-dependent methyltransferase [Eubacterium sp.]